MNKACSECPAVGAVVRAAIGRAGLIGAFLLSVAGCSGRGTSSDARAATEVPRPRLIRVTFATESSGAHHLGVADSVALADEVTAPLERFVDRAIRGDSATAGSESSDREQPRARTVRAYTFAVSDAAGPLDPWIIVDELDDGRSIVRVSIAGVESRFDVSVHLPALRERAFAALRRDMAAPLDVAWHYEALAGFLADPVALDETRAVRAWGDIAERIVRGREVEALAAALLDDRLRSAPNSAIETLARADAIDARVVALARDARNGDRGALRELVVLALEYHAKVELFDRALRWLFPIEINARIHARFPPDRPLEFLDALRAEFERCTFSTERGWSLASG